jgi:hypothetical protein
MALSKRKRFEVFKRDIFCCQYCGNTPPAVTLEVDHIVPVSKKGGDEIDNLITSCFDCNRGKSNIELSVLPITTDVKIALIKEKELQYKQYQKLLRSIETRLNTEVEQIASIYSQYFSEYELGDRFKNTSVKLFLSKLGYDEVRKAMEQACGKISGSSQAIKYFCGICWNIIKNKKNG